MADRRAQMDAWIEAHREEMLRDLTALVAIPSMKGPAQPGKPFGAEPARALEKMGELMEQYGLSVTNYDNYCIAGDLAGAEEKTLDILAHLDVVPVSDTWTVTQPFEAKVVGDRIYGRGSIDDKGPAVAALYALRAIRESGICLKNGVRLLCGSDEECGSQDLEYYYAREKEALYTFTPDGDYPVINIEKGRLSKRFRAAGKADAADTRVLRFAAGDKSNVIPGQAELVLAGVTKALADRLAAEAAGATGAGFAVKQEGETLRVRVQGRTGHAAHPEGGLNALTAGLRFVQLLAREEGAAGDSSGNAAGSIGSAAALLLQAAGLFPFGDHHGAALDIDYADEESGRLTITLDMLQYACTPDGAWTLEGCFDCRAPLCANDENLTAKVRGKLAAAGLKMEAGGMIPPHYVSADSELVRTLLDSYERYFGERGEPLAIGGGTYVHELERGVAFGCEMEGEDNHMHGDDESMSIPMLVRSAQVFADAILHLCGAEEAV